MSNVIVIPGGSGATAPDGDDAFLNYGTIINNTATPVSLFPVFFTVPADGYIKYASVGRNIATPNSYSLRNVTTSVNYINLLNVDSAPLFLYKAQTFADNLYPFAAGDRLIWTSDFTMPSGATTLTTFCKLTDDDKSYLTVRGAARQDFTTGATPFSYGAGSYDYSISVTNQFLQQKIPYDCYLRKVSMSANESTAALTADLTLDFYRNTTVNTASLTQSTGTFSSFVSYSTDYPFSFGDTFGIKIGGTGNTNVGACTFTALFELVEDN